MILELMFLYLTFFKLGLFTIGGGLVIIALLQNTAVTMGWLTPGEFSTIVGISQSTPGPIGINMATYVGYTQAGIIGSLVATAGLVTPSFIIIIIAARHFDAFIRNRYIGKSLSAMRPAVTGLIAGAAYIIARAAFIPANISLNTLPGFFTAPETLFFVAAAAVILGSERHPLLYVAIGAVSGILFL